MDDQVAGTVQAVDSPGGEWCTKANVSPNVIRRQVTLHPLDYQITIHLTQSERAPYLTDTHVSFCGLHIQFSPYLPGVQVAKGLFEGDWPDGIQFRVAVDRFVARQSFQDLTLVLLLVIIIANEGFPPRLLPLDLVPQGADDLL